MTSTQVVENSKEQLREMFPAGTTVTTVVRHVSRSGMQRAIAVLGTAEDGEPMNVSWLVARALGWPLHRQHDGVRVNGCGMDMCFHLIYTLSQALYGDGYALTNRTI